MIAEQRYDVKANWKVVAQNYLECYHCPSAHPTLCRAIEWGKGDRLIASDKAIGGYMDLCEGSETASVGGSITGRRLLGEQRPEDLRRVYSFFLFPNIIISLHPDYLLMYEFAALAPNLTTVSCEFWAVPESGADHCDVVDFWDQTLREDWTLCESVQRGIGEPSYQPGPYTLLERDVHAFDRWVARHHLAWQ
jgi:Rieske 2Fe-2S family protein